MFLRLTAVASLPAHLRPAHHPRMTIPAELIRQLAVARLVTVLTGAGVSAESGVPTFRDAQTGLWAKFKPEDLATPTAFRRNPRLVWDWYDWRRKRVADVPLRPSAARMRRHRERMKHTAVPLSPSAARMRRHRERMKHGSVFVRFEMT